MTTDYTHIAIILDRTGSMQSIRDDTIGGFNAFLAEQQAQPGHATLTLVQFDSQDAYEVIHRVVPIAEVPPLTAATFVPRASTPLLDAIGRGIGDLDASLAAMPEAERPGRIVFAIVTDGQENASVEFRKEDIARLIRERSEAADWQFVFLSADLAAFHDAGRYGIDADSRLAYDKTARGTSSSWSALSKRTAEYRSGKKRKIGFEFEDRQSHPEDPQPRPEDPKR